MAEYKNADKGTDKSADTNGGCCGGGHGNGGRNGAHVLRIDLILHGSLAVIGLTLALYAAQTLTGLRIPYAAAMGESVIDFAAAMWWGVVLGMVTIGIMGQVPRTFFSAILGRGDGLNGILRAALGGLFLDLCSHGILMVGAKLYERGASLAQVMTFLIASPWNSFSLTLILISLIGLEWTLLYIAGSVVVAVVSGLVFARLVGNGVLSPNPNETDLPENFDFVGEARRRLSGFCPDRQWRAAVLRDGWSGGRMVLRWLLFGIVLASAIRIFVPAELFQTYFGPTIAGLALTMVATAVIEVCSEGSAPVAADLLNRGGAPGNGFAFLMGGVATDYTEIMVLRETLGSWKAALFLPLVTLPQVFVLALIMNAFA